jgi:O-antigen biosynthesis protein
MRGHSLKIGELEAPQVSVILVLYGRSDLALRAITDLVANTPPCFELIIVDNASPDDSWSRVCAYLDGATLIQNSKNVGFGSAVNVGALAARGKYLLLLNSDVFVEPGWLPPLIETLESSPHLAAVGPLLRNIDGTVQEAGSMVFSGGEAQTVAIGDSMALDFPRSAPYVSAACLLVRRVVFNCIGGFDSIYGIGYYEDVEMAFDIQALGFGMGYVPNSHARHVGGASTNNVDEAWRLTFANREVFKGRWEGQLRSLPRFDEKGSIAATIRGRDALCSDRVLFIDAPVGPRCRRTPSAEGRLVSLAREVAVWWPSVRSTYLVEDRVRRETVAPELLTAGVEVAAPREDSAAIWFSERSGHYSAIVVAAGDSDSAMAALARQHNATALVVTDFACASERDLEKWTASPILLCSTAEQASAMRKVQPSRSIVILELGALAPWDTMSGPHQGLVELMAELGIAPTWY